MKLLLILTVLTLVVASASAGGCPHTKAGGSLTKTSVNTYKLTKKCPINGAQRSTLQLALKQANKDGGLGAKIGLRYLKAHPEAKALFPSLSSVAASDLATNNVFLAKSAACFAALTRFLSADNFDKSRGCPYTARTRGHYTTAQQLDFGRALAEAVAVELGERVTAEIKSALHATTYAVRSAAGVCPVNKEHRVSIGNTLREANRDGSLGPKTFAKYYQANPGAKKVSDSTASTCISALTLYYNPQVFGATNGCPFVEASKRYGRAEQRQLCLALLAAVKESGSDFDDKAVQAFRAAFEMAHSKH